MVHGLLLLLLCLYNAKQVREAVPLRPVWFGSLDWAALAHISFLDVPTLTPLEPDLVH